MPAAKRAEIEALVSALAPVVGDYVAKAFNPLRDKVVALEGKAPGELSFQEAFDEGFESVKGYVDRSFAAFEARIEALEARPTMKYTGTWEAREYQPGNVVTDGGSMWHCERKTQLRPGDNDAWRLCVKRGRDATK